MLSLPSTSNTVTGNLHVQVLSLLLRDTALELLAALSAVVCLCVHALFPCLSTGHI